MSLTRGEARQRMRGKKDSEYGTTFDKKNGKTESEIDGLCQPRHMSAMGTTKDKVRDRTGWRIIL